MPSLRSWSVALVLSFAAAGCAAETDESTASDSANLNAATCGLDPTSPASPRRLMDEPLKDPEDAETRLGCLRTILTRQKDDRAPFASLYTDITISARAAIDAGRFEDGVWVARYMTTFAELYREAFVGYADGRADEIPGSWRIAFDAARDERPLQVQHVTLGVNAHVNRDLAHTLYIVGIGERGAVRESRKRDHFKVNEILRENVDATLSSLAETYAPGLGQSPAAVMRILTETYYQAVAAGRLKAWVDAVALSDAFPFLRPAIEDQIEVTSKLIARTILVPTINEDLAEKLREIEAGN
ncbi:MAG: hypothetical protein KIT84_08185 [Labilithrix sp.]|nr:hypothetical protein [Labilithrix sp.]MCW5810975.1 hypothetical protein [Labilithrix sp.]